MKRTALSLQLYETAYFPDLWNQLKELASLAYPEGWRYKNPHFQSTCPEVEILTKYIRSVYRKNALDYNNAEDEYERALCISVDGRMACFNTGLYSRDYKEIFMLFTIGAPRDRTKDWTFSKFLLEDDPLIENMVPKPAYPDYAWPDYAKAFYLDWPLRIAFKQLARDREMLSHIPKELRKPDVLPDAIRGALKKSHAMAAEIPNFAVPILYFERIHYALPLYLTGGDAPDLAIVLAPLEAYMYTGHHLILPEMVYNNARLLGFIQAEWLRNLVVPAPAEMGQAASRA